MGCSEHITVNASTGCFECAHCGASYKPTMPCSSSAYIGMSLMFLREHRRCAPAALFAEADLPIMLRRQAD